MCVISEFAFNSTIMIFLYANTYIVYDSKRCLNSIIMFLIPKLFFHYFFIIRYDFALFSISKILIFKRPRFISIGIFSIISFSKFDLYLISRNFLIFLINVIIILFISFLFINIITFSPFTYIFIIAIIMFFVRYNTHNNFDFLIMSIGFLYLKYQLDKFLFDLYIRYLSS